MNYEQSKASTNTGRTDSGGFSICTQRARDAFGCCRPEESRDRTEHKASQALQGRRDGTLSGG